jgi:hypothetical protein
MSAASCGSFGTICKAASSISMAKGNHSQVSATAIAQMAVLGSVISEWIGTPSQAVAVPTVQLLVEVLHREVRILLAIHPAHPVRPDSPSNSPASSALKRPCLQRSNVSSKRVTYTSHNTRVRRVRASRTGRERFGHFMRYVRRTIQHAGPTGLIAPGSSVQDGTSAALFGHTTDCGQNQRRRGPWCPTSWRRRWLTTMSALASW